MSLTSFLEKNADVRARFLVQFTKPEFRIKSPLLAPPLTKSSGLAGTAFDYLLRFHVEKLNPDTTTRRRWIAEVGAERCDPAVANKARRLLDEAKKRHSAFLKSKRPIPPPALIEAAVWLASLDTVFRIGFVDPKMFTPAPSALIKSVPPASFTAVHSGGIAPSGDVSQIPPQFSPIFSLLEPSTGIFQMVSLAKSLSQPPRYRKFGSGLGVP